MASLNATAERLAWRSLLRMRGEEVVYRVNESLSIPLRAVVSRPQNRAMSIEQDDGFLLARTWQVLVDPIDLVDRNGNAVEPRVGHESTAESGDVYRLTNNDQSDTCWRWSSAAHTFLRLNTSLA